jgi:phosphonate transport system substrate-binding protein
MLAAYPSLRMLTAAEASPPIRLAISETMVTDVNLSDARIAMETWLKRIQADLAVTLQYDARVFVTTEEIVSRIRTGQLDAAALNVVEYRSIAEMLDPTDLLVGSGTSGPDNYLLLVRRDSAFKKVANLRGSRLTLLTSPKMCAARAWLATLLDEAQCPPAEEFFAAMTPDTKVSRVLLPVFFHQTESCLVSKRGFETMCELNPQVEKELTPIAISPVLVTCFYAFRKNYRGSGREKIVNLHKTLLSGAAGRQLAMLFQFDELTVRDASCLASGLSILDRAERIRSKTAPGGRKSEIGRERD